MTYILKLKKISLASIIRFVFPSYICTLCTSIYTIVDGIFVAQNVGTYAIAGINVAYPLLNLMTGIGVMLAAGGSAMLGQLLGKKKIKEAREAFSLFFIFALILSLILSIFILIVLPWILKLLGATSKNYEYCRIYATIGLIGYPVGIAREIIVYFLRVNGMPKVSTYCAILGGITNIILDAVFILVFGFGIAGAAWATVLALTVSCIYGIFHFLRIDSPLQFKHFKWNWKLIIYTTFNGSSELLGQIAAGFTTILFNHLAYQYMGDDGIAAISAIMYLQFIFQGIFFGYSMGLSPVISYYKGSNKYYSILKLLKCSRKFILLGGTSMLLLCQIIASFLIILFIPGNSSAYPFTLTGLRIYGLSFAVVGINILASALFTAIGDGKISLYISFSHSLVFITAFLLLLPPVFGIIGIWLAVPLAEAVTAFFSIWQIRKLVIKYDTAKSLFVKSY